MFIVAILILIMVFSATSWYLSFRTHQGLSSFFPKIRFWQILTVVGAITLFLVLGFLRSRIPMSEDIKYILGWISSFCMAVLLYLLLFTVLADLIFIVPKVMKVGFTNHRFFKGFITVGVLFATLTTCVYGYINASQIDVVSYNIEIQGKKDISDLNIVMLSDLHLGSVGSEGRLEDIVDSINELDPDIVCIAGDFFDTDFSSVREPETAIKTLQKLKSTYGVYACFGNHDGGKTYDKMVDFLGKANINLLDDTYTVIDERLVLAGRLDKSPIGGHGKQKRKDFSEIYKAEKADLPIIVLDHNPKRIGEYGNEADLILCGHTHKGQVFPGNLITNVIYEVDYGYYRKNANSPQVIVSSGVGYWGMPVRVGSDCEIVNITFDL